MTTPPDAGPDLRLLLPAAVLWLALLLAFRCSPPVLFGALGFVPPLLAVVLRQRRRWRGAAAPALTALLCASAGVAIVGLRGAARESGPLPQLAKVGAVAELTVELAADPIERSGVEANSGRPYTLVIAPAQAVVLDAGNRRWRLRQPVLLLANDRRWAGLLPGQRIHTVGRLQPPRAHDQVTAVVTVRGPPMLRGEPPPLQRAAGRLRKGLRDAAAGLPAGERALLPGLVDGDTSSMSPDRVQDFRRTGLTHLVAVSGANVAYVSGAFMWLARRFRAGPRVTGVVGLLSVLGFVVLARPSASVLRAAVMGGLALVGIILERPRAALSGLAGAVFLLLLIEPALATAPGFQLSVSATLGLLVLAPPWRRRLARHLPDGVATALAVPAAAQAACSPLIAMIGGGVSVVAVPANMLAAPAVGPATVLGVIAAATAPWAPPIAGWCAEVAGLPCGWLLLLAHRGARIPFASVGWPAGVAGAALFVAVACVVVLGATFPVAHRSVPRAILRRWAARRSARPA